MSAFSSIYSRCLAAQATGYTAKQTDGQGHTPMPSHAGSASSTSSMLTAHHISIACAPPHAGVGAFEPAGVGRPLPSSLQHLQPGFILILWDPLQELLPRTISHCCLPMVLAPGKVPGIGWGLGYFFPIIFTNRRQFLSLCHSLHLSWLSLSSPSGSFYFQIVMQNS